MAGSARNARVAAKSLSLATCALFILAGAMLVAASGAPQPGSTAISQKHSSSIITITADGETLLVVNPDSNSLTLVDTTSHEILAEIPVGVDPRSVAVSADGGTAYVANQGSDSLSVVDVAARTLLAHYGVGDRPVGVVLSPDGRFLAVAELGVDQVRFVDATNLSTLAVHSVADRPHGLAFTPDGQQLLISHLLSGSVTLLPVRPFTTYLPLAARASPAQGIASLVFPAAARTSPTTVPTWPGVAPAPSVLINASGTRAYLPQTMANGQGLNVQFDTTVFPKVSVLNLVSDSHQTSEHISLPETDRPVGLPWDAALNRDDTELWVVNSASNDVSVIDISTPKQPSRVANLSVGDNPRGIVQAPDGKRAYVYNALAGTVSVLDTNAYTTTKVITVTAIPLPPVLLHGKRIFHSSARPDLAQAAWISCNTCHVEGEHDGRTWLLQFTGELPPGQTPIITRNTTSLMGMIETYPLRWSGEWDESADSEFSIRFEQFGSGLISGDLHPTLAAPNQGRSYDLDCLALFIDGLAAPPRSQALSQAQQRGKTIFESAQTRCAECHPAPLYADFQAHDVGTAGGPGEWFGTKIDTPSLRYLFDSAPYLHDGSAATLLNVLTTGNLDDAHGATTHLDEQELEDLAAFLSALPFEE